jgi:hypothetical protein
MKIECRFRFWCTGVRVCDFQNPWNHLNVIKIIQVRFFLKIREIGTLKNDKTWQFSILSRKRTCIILITFRWFHGFWKSHTRTPVHQNRKRHSIFIHLFVFFLFFSWACFDEQLEQQEQEIVQTDVTFIEFE